MTNKTRQPKLHFRFYYWIRCIFIFSRLLSDSIRGCVPWYVGWLVSNVKFWKTRNRLKLWFLVIWDKICRFFLSAVLCIKVKEQLAYSYRNLLRGAQNIRFWHFYSLKKAPLPIFSTQFVANPMIQSLSHAHRVFTVPWPFMGRKQKFGPIKNDMSVIFRNSTSKLPKKC